MVVFGLHLTGATATITKEKQAINKKRKRKSLLEVD